MIAGEPWWGWLIIVPVFLFACAALATQVAMLAHWLWEECQEHGVIKGTFFFVLALVLVVIPALWWVGFYGS
jgi:formate-dependent nitrite reductase membrane component NrfD